MLFGEKIWNMWVGKSASGHCSRCCRARRRRLWIACTPGPASRMVDARATWAGPAPTARSRSRARTSAAARAFAATSTARAIRGTLLVLSGVRGLRLLGRACARWTASQYGSCVGGNFVCSAGYMGEACDRPRCPNDGTELIVESCVAGQCKSKQSYFGSECEQPPLPRPRHAQRHRARPVRVRRGLRGRRLRGCQPRDRAQRWPVLPRGLRRRGLCVPDDLPGELDDLFRRR